MPTQKWAWFWVCVGLVLFIIEMLEWFRFEPFGYHFPIGVLATLYGGLILIYYRARAQALKLTPEDLATYGPALERSVSVIMDMLEKKKSARSIAEHVHAQQGVPHEITYKYIIAIGSELNQQSDPPDAEEPQS